jgi:hypothetical protein
VKTKTNKKTNRINRLKEYIKKTNGVSLSEWLRRLIRNQLVSYRAGSNPAADVFIEYLFKQFSKFISVEN